MEFNFDDLVVYNWVELRPIVLELELSTHALHKMLSNQEEFGLKLKGVFDKEIQDDVEFNSLEYYNIGGYYQAFYEIEEKTIKELRKQQRYAFMLTIYSYFEGKLKSLCTKIEKEFSFDQKLYNSKGENDLMKYYNYLKNVLQIETQNTDVFFDHINSQKNTKNKIAHQNGFLYKNDTDKITIIDGLTINELENEKNINIDANYLSCLSANIENFFKALIPAIDERYKSLQQN